MVARGRDLLRYRPGWRDQTCVSLQLQWGLSIGIADVSHDSPSRRDVQESGLDPADLARTARKGTDHRLRAPLFSPQIRGDSGRSVGGAVHICGVDCGARPLTMSCEIIFLVIVPRSGCRTCVAPRGKRHCLREESDGSTNRQRPLQRPSSHPNQTALCGAVRGVGRRLRLCRRSVES